MSPTPHEIFKLGDFALDCGTTLPDAHIAYATYGTPNAARDNVVVFPSWYLGSHADIEWFIGGPDKPIDSTKYFVIAPSMFANGLSSSPSNTPAPYDHGRFPAISIQDNVRAQHRLVTERFSVSRIQLVIGGSMGAFQAYQWALAHPDLVLRMAAMCGSARCTPHCYVFLAGAKAALLADPAYAGGDYTQQPAAGMKAMARVWAGWALSQTFYREHLYRRMGHDTVDGFLINFWEAFWLNCDANDLLNQLETWQSADISRTPGYGGDLGKALGAIRAKAVLCPGESDLYFPPADMRSEAAQMRDSELSEIPGPWGHFSEVGIDPDCNQYLTRAIQSLLAR
ncbi:MAG: alpha/beta fold hydrolase [Geminicoccaceae bacterium]